MIWVMLYVLKFLMFFNANVCYMPVVGLFILLTMNSSSQATPERERLLSGKPGAVYTDRLAFFQSRVDKLQAIIERAQSAQSKIRHNPSYRTHWDQQQALQPWKRIEEHARRMLVEIQDRIQMLAMQSMHRRLQPGRDAAKARRPIAKNVLLTRLDGKQEQMATHRGDVVLLHFWATWCRPCTKEIPSLQRLYQQFRSEDFTVLAVSLDARKTEIDHFFQRQPLRLPVYFDPGRVVYQEMIGGLEVLPRSLLIDKKGRIVQSYTGGQHLTAPATFTDIQNLLDTN
jgi:peroxiredoxin